MTRDRQTAGIPADRPEQERPADPRPAWERVAYTWLEREVDAGQPVDPANWPGRSAWHPGWRMTWCGCCGPSATATLLWASCGHGWYGTGSPTPTCGGSWPVAGGLTRPSWPAEVGTTAAVARQWLAGLRAQHTSAGGLEVLGRAGQPRPPHGRAAGRVAGLLRRRRPPARRGHRPPCRS